MTTWFLNPDNRLLTLARSGKRMTHIVVSLILAVLMPFMAQLTGIFAALPIIILLKVGRGEIATTDIMPMLASGEEAQIIRLFYPSAALDMVVFLVALFAPIFLFIWLWLYLFEKRHLWTIGLELPIPTALYKYGRGVLVGIGTFAMSIGVLAALGWVDFEAGSPNQQGIGVAGLVLVVYLGWMVQGAAEEALTRGWLLPTLGARYNIWVGIIASSLLFAVLHMLNPSVSLIAMLNLFLVGIFAALYALYEESLWGVCGFHSAWNWTQGNLFGFEVSGNDQLLLTVINLQEVGPNVITGGPFGPEGGLAVTAVLVLSSVIVWALGRQKWTQPSDE